MGNQRQFRVNGAAEGQTLTFRLVRTSADDDLTEDDETTEVAALTEDGLLTALAGGWVIVGAWDGDANAFVAQTDTIWLAGGPTRIDRRGGRAFAAEDLYVCAVFPPKASQRPITVQIRKQAPADLPEQAQGQGRAVSVYQFDVIDAETGDDVGGRGFHQLVSLTLGYDDTKLPDGVTEEQLVAACFDPDAGAWRKISRAPSALAFVGADGVRAEEVGYTGEGLVLEATAGPGRE